MARKIGFLPIMATAFFVTVALTAPMPGRAQELVSSTASAPTIDYQSRSPAGHEAAA